MPNRQPQYQYAASPRYRSEILEELAKFLSGPVVNALGDDARTASWVTTCPPQAVARVVAHALVNAGQTAKNRGFGKTTPGKS